MGDEEQIDPEGDRTQSDPTMPEEPKETHPVNNLHGDQSGARALAVRQREGQMVELRLAGVPVDQIAEQFNVHHSTVSHIITRAMKRTSAPAAELKELELRRLDRIIYAYWRDALGTRREREGQDPEIIPPDPKAADVVIKALDRRHKLLGLDKVVIEVGMSQEERASALADSMRSYLQGRKDAETERELNELANRNGDGS